MGIVSQTAVVTNTNKAKLHCGRASMQDLMDIIQYVPTIDD